MLKLVLRKLIKMGAVVGFAGFVLSSGILVKAGIIQDARAEHDPDCIYWCYVLCGTSGDPVFCLDPCLAWCNQ